MEFSIFNSECMYVCVYVCTYVFVCVCVCVCTHTVKYLHLEVAGTSYHYMVCLIILNVTNGTAYCFIQNN